jgi:hypothetical protein
MRTLLLLVLSALLLAAPLRAQPLPGAESPEFATARAQWLAGEDMAALEAFSALAQGGNVAAQLMLGAIEPQRYLSPEAAFELPRAERIALWRAPGGLSGTSWLRARSEDQPLAAALQIATFDYGLASPRELRAALETLLEAGEGRAAMAVLATASNQGGWVTDGGWNLLLRFGAHPALGGHGVALLASLNELAMNPATAVADPAQAAAVAAALAAADAPPNDVRALRAAMRANATLQSGDLAAAQEAAGKSAVAAPFRAICADACPQGTNACTFALLAAVGGLPSHVTLSPLESVIPTAEYRKSPRFARDLRNGIGLPAQASEEARLGRRAHLAQFDSCAATAIYGPE